MQRRFKEKKKQNADLAAAQLMDPTIGPEGSNEEMTVKSMLHGIGSVAASCMQDTDLRASEQRAGQADVAIQCQMDEIAELKLKLAHSRLRTLRRWTGYSSDIDDDDDDISSESSFSDDASSEDPDLEASEVKEAPKENESAHFRRSRLIGVLWSIAYSRLWGTKHDLLWSFRSGGQDFGGCEGVSIIPP